MRRDANTGKMLHINSEVNCFVRREGVGWHLTDEDVSWQVGLNDFFLDVFLCSESLCPVGQKMEVVI